MSPEAGQTASLETQPSVAGAPEVDLRRFLLGEQRKDLLRFTTAGSVDDGKSTLIGRLLYDSKNVYEDNLRSVAKASVNRSAGPIDFSLLTDGLKAEREQGITIDVAYRYFATTDRKYIIADTPGHEQYTRNMATGASTADAAIILIDARHGVLAQSRRHVFIASLLGIRHFIIAINKMDLVEYSEQRFDEICVAFKVVLDKLHISDAYFLPISALRGDNVVDTSQNMPWFRGLPLLGHLESLRLRELNAEATFRLPVQYVIRPDQNFRGYAGQIAAGTVRPGMQLLALPAGRKSRVKRIATFDGDLDCAQAPMSITLTLEDEIDISRGDLLCVAEHLPYVARTVESTLVWMNDQPMELDRRYILKHAGHMQPAEVKKVGYRINFNTLEHEPSAALALNEIGAVIIESARPLFFDPYRSNRTTGSFILIDPVTNATVAAGMLIQPATAFEQPKRSAADAALITPGTIDVTSAERLARYGHAAFNIGLGTRDDLARLLERKLFDRGCSVAVLREPNLQTLQDLEKAGMIAIVLGASSDPLPENDEEAVTQILTQLELSGVLLRANAP